MSESLWNCTAAELLARASSTDPTPGGGSVAAVTAAFGFALVQMALSVTLAGAELESGPGSSLRDALARCQALQRDAAAAVDRDVAEFDAVMAAYRLPRETEAEQQARERAIDEATVTATQGPLGLAEAAVAGIWLVDDVEPLIKRTIVSDAEAGRDLLRGAALAALRTVDINLVPLERRGYSEAANLRRRRDAVASTASDARRSA